MRFYPFIANTYLVNPVGTGVSHYNGHITSAQAGLLGPVGPIRTLVVATNQPITELPDFRWDVSGRLAIAAKKNWVLTRSIALSGSAG